MTTYKSYSSKKLYEDVGRAHVLKEFFGEDLYKQFEEPIFIPTPKKILGAEVKDLFDSNIRVMYLATKFDYTVDYNTAMSMYKQFHDKSLEEGAIIDKQMVCFATGLNRTTMHDAIPLILLNSMTNLNGQEAIDRFHIELANCEDLLNGCWLTSSMPTVIKKRYTDTGPRLTYTFGKKVPEKNRLAFQVYVSTYNGDHTA